MNNSRPTQKVPGRVRPLTPTPPKQNKTEAAYDNYLHLLKLAGEIIDYKFEPLRIRLADLTTYTPDFLVIYSDRLEFHEVKGFWRDDARVKIKVAAEQYPWFVFLAVQKDNKSRDGWKVEYINHKDLS